VLPLIIFLFLAEYKIHNMGRHYLCCSVNSFDSLIKEFDDLKIKNSLPLPAVANPDLGVMSWSKHFNVVDIGFLGNPVIAGLKDRHHLLANYILEFSAPDFIESHGTWSCSHHYIFEDKRFKKRYTEIRGFRGGWLMRKCISYPTVKDGLWVRKDILKGADSAERRLIDAMSKKIDPSLIEKELKICNGQKDPLSCLYVARTIYRFLPQIRKNNYTKKIEKALAGTKNSDYTTAILNSSKDGRWYLKVIKAVEKFTEKSLYPVNTQKTFSKPLLRQKTKF
jgi:hypothetical protein